MKKTTIDIISIAIVLILSFLLFGKIDLLEKIVMFSSAHEDYEVDEIISTFIILSICLVIFSIRRWKEAVNSLKIITYKNKELSEAKKAMKKLEGIIPISVVSQR